MRKFLPIVFSFLAAQADATEIRDLVELVSKDNKLFTSVKLPKGADTADQAHVLLTNFDTEYSKEAKIVRNLVLGKIGKVQKSKKQCVGHEIEIFNCCAHPNASYDCISSVFSAKPTLIKNLSEIGEGMFYGMKLGSMHLSMLHLITDEIARESIRVPFKDAMQTLGALEPTLYYQWQGNMPGIGRMGAIAADDEYGTPTFMFTRLDTGLPSRLAAILGSHWPKVKALSSEDAQYSDYQCDGRTIKSVQTTAFETHSPNQTMSVSTAETVDLIRSSGRTDPVFTTVEIASDGADSLIRFSSEREPPIQGESELVRFINFLRETSSHTPEAFDAFDCYIGSGQSGKLLQFRNQLNSPSTSTFFFHSMFLLAIWEADIKPVLSSFAQ